MIQCKSDPTNGSVAEDTYFEDYEIPAKKWGFIDTSGAYTVEPKYDQLRPYQHGLARANFEGRWGFIDLNGQNIIPHQYRSVFPFNDGLARIQNFDKKFGFIDRNNKLQIQDTFTQVFDFNSGLARAKLGPLYGYIDTKGTWKIEPTFKTCSNFKNGFATVKQYGFYGLIDSTGQLVLDYNLHYNRIYSPVFNKLYVKKNKNYFYIDLSKPNELHGPFKKATPLTKNHQTVATKDGKTWTFLDHSFNEIGSIEAESVQYAQYNLWIFEKDKQFGLCSSDGTIITAESYQMIYPFHEGFALCSQKDYWGFLGITGSFEIPPIFPLAWAFNNGHARIISGGLIGYINQQGKLAFKDGFEDAHDFSEGRAHVQE